MVEIRRPNAKQRAVLDFIRDFIAQHGYSPSYREVAEGLEYASVATAALHISNLIKKGHLQTTEGGRRTLEVISPNEDDVAVVSKVEAAFRRAEEKGIDQAAIKDLSTLVDALEVLGMTDSAGKYSTRLRQLIRAV